MPDQTRLRFTVAVGAVVADGDTVCIMGDCVALGDFDEKRAVALVKRDEASGTWTLPVPIVVTRGFPVHYRCVCRAECSA
jgi:hypothetical protein